MTMQVVKRDGTHEEVKIEKILHAVNRACRGLDRVESWPTQHSAEHVY